MEQMLAEWGHCPEEAAGPAVALASGLIYNGADDDEGALDLVRECLSFVPSSP
jgi:hypothetical protein